MPHHMPNCDHLCSELVRISTPQGPLIAALESINRNSCTLFIEQPIPIDSRVTMSCLECPRGKKVCTECVFKCHISGPSSLLTAAGYEVKLELDSRPWNADQWRPHHLIALDHTAPENHTDDAGIEASASKHGLEIHEPSHPVGKKILAHAH